LAYDDRLRVEAKLEDPKVASGDGDVDSDSVSSVRGSKGAWPWYRVGGGSV
jgi:hypothetical protein